MTEFDIAERALNGIEEKHVYCDEKSEEKRTGVKKRKYKLAGYWYDEITKATGLRRFFISTTDEDAVAKRERIIITPSDYAFVRPSFRRNLNQNSIYSLRKTELLSGTEIQAKQVDPENGFLDVATVSDEAFEKFYQKIGTVSLRQGETSEELAEIVKSVTDISIIEEELKSRGLSIK